MAVNIIDRRQGAKNKNAINRYKFLQRVKSEVKKVVKDGVVNGKVSDIIGKKEYKVSVKKTSIYEPELEFEKGSGSTKSIHTGNKEFTKGDTIPKPPEGDGSGSGPDGEGEDDFSFVLTQQDFLNIFFEDLALPRLLKAKLLGIEKPKYRRGGISTTGTPPRINILRTFRQSLGRQAAIKFPLQEQLEELEKQLKFHEETLRIHTALAVSEYPDIATYKEVVKKIKELREEIDGIPFLDDVDVRYNRLNKENTPAHKAVMFCLMDVSMSMGEWEKEVAKRFFMLLYIFLTRVYKQIDIVFIRYHSEAKEVDEEEFFHSRETGGTQVSPALKLMKQIMDERYNSDWNMYCCHASDGDNWEEDNPSTEALLEEIVVRLQYYAYVQIHNHEMLIALAGLTEAKELWVAMDKVQQKHPNLIGKGIIHTITEIWPVFEKLFEKEVDA